VHPFTTLADHDDEWLRGRMWRHGRTVARGTCGATTPRTVSAPPADPETAGIVDALLGE